jgi:hypothetical protein
MISYNDWRSQTKGIYRRHEISDAWIRFKKDSKNFTQENMRKAFDKLEAIPNSGGGDCLFLSVAQSFKSVSGDDCRFAVARTLTDEHRLRAGLEWGKSFTTIESCRDHCAQKGRWGTDLDIEILCDISGTRMYIFTVLRNGDLQLLCVNPRASRTIFIRNFHRIHFELMRSKKTRRKVFKTDSQVRSILGPLGRACLQPY